MQIGSVLPFVALAGAVIVVLLYLYYVKGMFRVAPRAVKLDLAGKMRNIKKLMDAGKYAAAITLAYRTFEQMCGARIGSERTNSETAREYIERVLKVIPLDPVAVDAFTSVYEEARFSGHEITREQCEYAIRVFTDLYPKVDLSIATE